jgi:hypothetical protein
MLGTDFPYHATGFLCYRADIKPILYYGDDCEPISTFGEHYKWMAQKHYFDNYFISRYFKYPISSDELYLIADDYVDFYPVYDSYIQIALGKPVRFLELVGELNKWIKAEDKLGEDESAESQEETVGELPAADISKAKVAAEQRVKVMPSIRWQVFQRDDWKCVACGQGSHDDVILHVDHITPRSKGGKDTFENYQTLCHVCNIGKSNKDATDLRRKRKSLFQ